MLLAEITTPKSGKRPRKKKVYQPPQAR